MTEKSGYTTEDYIEDLRVMIDADMGHLMDALLSGDRVIAHGFVNSIIDNRRILEDRIKDQAQG